MRPLFLTLCLLLGIVIAPAKDIITKTDGTKTEAIVVEITETAVKFRKPTNPTGPVYNLPLKSVATITYENGTIDYFNQAPPVATSPASNSQLSDEELINMSETQMPVAQNSYVSDRDLIRMSKMPTQEEILRKKAKTYRIIGWTGGTLLVGAGLALGIYMIDNYARFNDADGPLAIVGGLLAGGFVGIYFNLKANSLMKQAREIESYSAAMFQQEVLKLGKSSLLAGVNVMGNRMTHTNGLGLSLSLNF